jgi:hypothetical protein
VTGRIGAALAIATLLAAAGCGGSGGGGSSTETAAPTASAAPTTAETAPAETAPATAASVEPTESIGAAIDDVEPTEVSASGDTYYVSRDGDDNAEGTSEATAWRTISRVNGAQLQPGDHVLFQGGGSWAEMLQPQSSGTKDAPIVFGTYGDGRAVLSGKDGTGFAGIALVGNSWLSFENLEVADRSVDQQQDLIYVEGVHDISFAHMDLHDGFGGVHSSPDKHSARVTVSDSRITGFHGGGASHGVNVPAGDTGWLIQDSEISGADDSCLIDLGTANRYERLAVHDCGFGTSEQGAHGLYLRGPQHVVSDSHVWNTRTSCVSVRFQGDRVLGNDLHDCEVGISFFDYSTKAGEIEMARNRIWDTDIGIYADNTKRIGFKISNNAVLGGRADGKAGQGINLAFVRSAAITNNIVTGNADPALRVDHTDDGYQESNNDLSVEAAKPIIFGQNPKLSVEEYVKASGQGEGTTSDDPQLVSTDPADPDLSLQDGSPLIDAGTAASAVGAMKPACDGSVLAYCGDAPDIGAAELSP